MTALETILADLPNLAIAVSGGVDSMTLAHAAHRAGLPGLLVVHALSPAVPAGASASVTMRLRFGWRATWRSTRVNSPIPSIARTPVNRCYFCKTNLYAARIVHVTEGADRLGRQSRRSWRLPAWPDRRGRNTVSATLFVEAGMDKAAGPRSSAIRN